MKKLRRLLALTISALMLAGLLVPGAAAADIDFTDRSRITYTEAVDVMTTLGVFQGNSSGAFDPDGILTREQAAKIICCMLNGQEEAEALQTGEPIFADVSTARWSAPYIAFCVERGILSGDGSGSFYPEQALTGAAFAKMLLVALNYDPAIEGFTGSDWVLNVASMAVNLGVAPGSLNLMDALSRQNAALMCYNTLTQDLARYKGVNELFTNRPAVGKIENYYGSDYNGSNDGVQQFCEAYFPDLALVTVYDGFSRPVRCWTYGGDSIHYTSLTPVAVFTWQASAREMASSLKSFSLRDSAYPGAGKPVSDSGEATFDAAVNLTFLGMGESMTQTSCSIQGQSTAAFLAGLTGNGRQVEFYVNERNLITDIVVITYSVNTLTAINSAPGKTAYTVGGVSYLDYQNDLTPDTVVLHGVVRVGDTVTYAVINGVAHIYPTTRLDGVLTQLNSGWAVISGENYQVGSAVAGAAELTCSSASQTFCLDRFGNVVDVISGVRSSGYVRVVSTAGSYTPADEALGLPASGPALTVTAVDASGVVGWYTVALHTITEADVTQGGPYAWSGASARLEPGDVVVRNTDILVYDASADNTPQSVNAAAAALLGSWACTVEGDTITLQPLSVPSDAMNEYSPYLCSGLDLTGLSGASITQEGCILTTDSNTTYVIYDPATGQAARYQGAANLPQGTALTNADVIVIAYGPNLGNSLVVFASR